MRFVLLVLLLVAAYAHARVPLKTAAEEKAADPVMGPAAGWTVRMDIDGYFPDEDILVSTKSPDFWKQGPGAFITKPPYLNGKERQKYHRVYIFPTGEDWTEHKVTIVPDADGKLTLTCYAVAPGAMHIVHWDDIRVESATLENGGFESAADNGTPEGWTLRGWGNAPKGRYITDTDDAAEGEDYVMSSWSWHWNATMTDVVKDQPIVLRWKNRFVPPETRYPVRIAVNGLHGPDPEQHTKFELASGMGTRANRPERYVGRLLDAFDADAYGGHRAAGDALGIYLGQAGKQWVERALRIEPKTDGELELTFHATRIRDVEEGEYKPVSIDYQIEKVEGATLPNPQFSDEDGDYVPDGWKQVGFDQDFRILRQEADGQTLARTWYQAGLRAALKDVKAGRPVLVHMRVRAPGSQEQSEPYSNQD